MIIKIAKKEKRKYRVKYQEVSTRFQMV
jgi:hypothetical protein